MKLYNSREESAVKRKYGMVFSKSRLIRRVAPPYERLCSIVFDRSPSTLPVGDSAGLTEIALETLKERGWRATFCVFGSTASCYPDKPGRAGGKYERGTRYEHIPGFALDDLGGIEALPDLTRRIAREGHEFALAGYIGLTYSPERGYRSRMAFKKDGDALLDLNRLRRSLYELTMTKQLFAAPMTNAARLPSGADVFSMYETAGLHYLRPAIDLRNMNPHEGARLIRETVETTPTVLSGAIIHLPGALNIRGESLTRSDLEMAFDALEVADFRVITAGELLGLSAFEDVPNSAPYFDDIRFLDSMGYAVGFRDNRFLPDREFTKAELTVFALGADTFPRAVDVRRDMPASPKSIAAAVNAMFGGVTSQPRTSKRADVYSWFAKIVRRQN